MSDDAPDLPVSRKARSGSQTRQRRNRHVCHTDDGEEARFQARLAEWRTSTAAQEHGTSESAFMRYYLLEDGARRPLRKAPQRKLTLPSEILLTQLLGRHNRATGLFNQLMRAVNGGLPVDRELLEDVLRRHREVCDAMAEALGIGV